MWTQVAHTTLFSASIITSTTVVLDIPTGFPISNFANYWIIIAPKSTTCEIRKVLSGTVSGATATLNIAIAASFAHAIGTEVYLQTSPIWDIELFGADPNHDASTNTTAINNAAYDCDKNGGGIVWIPKGEFLINNNPDLDVLKVKHGAYDGCIDISAMTNIKFIGDGMGISILKIEEGFYDQYNLHLFFGELLQYANSPSEPVTDHPCKNIEWHHLTMIGNRYLVEADEQSHCICINGKTSFNSGHSYSYSTDFVISNVSFIDAISDGIKASVVQNLFVNDCRFINCGRSGITIQVADEEVLIDSNYFEDTNDQDIDFEPSGLQSSISPNKFVISNNIIIKKSCNYLAISLGGFINSPKEERYIVSGNMIKGGGILVYRCRNLEITDNNIITGNGKWAFQSLSLLENCVIANNTITSNTLRLDTVNIGYEYATYKNDVGQIVEVYLQAKNIVVSGNVLTNGGFNFDSVNDLSITDNKIIQNGKKTSLGIRIALHEDLQKFGISNFGPLTITGNDITNAGYAGIWLSSNNPTNTTYQNKYYNVCLDNNIIAGAYLKYGVLVSQRNKKVFWEKLMIGTANTVISEQSDAESISVFTDYMTGTNVHEENWITTKIPEGVLDASQGAMAVYNGIAGDNKYQKNSLKGDINGWMLVSELDRQVLLFDLFEFAGTSSTINLDTHIPSEENIYGNQWYTPTPVSRIKIQHTSPIYEVINHYTSTTPANNFSFIDSNKDGEIKGIFRIDTSVLPTFPASVGIIFRSNGTNTSCWLFYFKYLSLGNYEVWLENLGASTPVSLSIPVLLDASMLFNLKIMMQGDFISAYYNDLLLWTVFNNYNHNEISHGIVFNTTSNQLFFCRSFKHLIH